MISVGAGDDDCRKLEDRCKLKNKIIHNASNID